MTTLKFTLLTVRTIVKQSALKLEIKQTTLAILLLQIKKRLVAQATKRYFNHISFALSALFNL
ncbi:hypothetical protein [Photobacterium profundum]|uniref:hypothetical protein n=1 Tax=Photobacterium profundum TaxID=74109 RepID=UPI0015E6C1A6|nr:hypothetical protein [Photobacterium profundum]